MEQLTYINIMNSFRHLPDNIIEINGEPFDLELFLEVEPDYSLPEGIINREYIPSEHHILFSKDNQTQGEFPWDEGDRYILRVPDLELLINEIEEDSQYVESLKDAGTNNTIKSRTTEYPHTDELIVAMWEHFVEGKPKKDTINKVQEERIKVKEQFPK